MAAIVESSASSASTPSLDLKNWDIVIDSTELTTLGRIQVVVRNIADPSIEFRINQSVVNGVTYPMACPQTRWNYLDGVIKYRPSDIIVATYPKCGTTWTEQVVLLLLSASQGVQLDPASKNTYRPGDHSIGKIWPEACVEQQGLATSPGPEFAPISLRDFDEAPAPRVIKSHAPIQLLLGSNGEGVKKLPEGTKLIAVSRNPLDACVSSYYHAFNPFKSGWPFDAWAKLWFEGYFAHGSWYDWVQGWQAHANDVGDRMLWLQYEDMLADPLRNVQRIAAFLGLDANDLDLMNHVVSSSSFDAMKEQSGGANHLRRGICGDWRAHFTRDMAQAFKDRFRERFAGSDIRFILGENEIMSSI